MISISKKSWRLGTAFTVVLLFYNYIKISSRVLKIEQIRKPEYDELTFNESQDLQGNPKISWEDEDWINYEKTRVGPGENGAYVETDPVEIQKNNEWLLKEGFYVGVSNKMSLTRALVDVRLPRCKELKYFKNLPSVSVIITFHNEILSTLLRCVFSVYNRSPKQVLHEIILINDRSTFPELYDELKQFTEKNFGSKVKITNNEQREGLIRARIIGAEKATGDVIIFLDSHMEVGNSWLPPLLDPLVTHPTYATVPVCDGMDPKAFNLEYTGNGFRGVFDWNFRYQWLPLRPQDREAEGQPFELPCMTGGSYAIRRDNFFRLGGYDDGLKIWNGENFEMCLKLWRCSGGILEVPCSRVVHLTKTFSSYRFAPNQEDFEGRNLKRIAEVWLDDYKKYFYDGDRQRYDPIDPGDLTKQFELKEKLNCKPFQYFLDVVAPEILQRYPVPPQYFAEGQIRSMIKGDCIMMLGFYEKIGLESCAIATNFTLTLERSLKIKDPNDQCLQSEKLNFFNCHHQFLDQYWKFDINSRQIIDFSGNCITASKVNNSISLLKCNRDDAEQRWEWTFENKTALTNWSGTGFSPGGGL